MSFLALDAMLGWKVKKIDGSWTEWGNLSDGVGDSTPPVPPALPVGSVWALNNSTYTDNLNQASNCTSGNVMNCGRVACVDFATDAPLGGFVAPDQTNENDKQICATRVPLTDCNSNPN